MTNPSLLKLQRSAHWRQQGPEFTLAHHFAELLCRLAGPADNTALQQLYLAATAASLASSQQNACVDLKSLAQQPLSYLPLQSLLQPTPQLTPQVNAQVNAHATSPLTPLLSSYPPLADWLAGLQQFPQLVGQPGDFTPLVMVGSRLYLYRYWEHEQKLAELLLERASASLPLTTTRQALQQLFPSDSGGAPLSLDYQALACLSALGKRLCLIAGGPGTGKTTTVSKILLLLLQSQPDLKIVLSAPTGKAAGRMQQALKQSLQQLQPPAELLSALPSEAQTLHRLLGFVPGNPQLRYHVSQPLPADVVIVDEASMIDIALMRRLVEAVRPDARLLLLGDPHQLASVETGSVLGDLCQAFAAQRFSASHWDACSELLPALNTSRLERSSEPQASRDDCLVELQVSHRFQAQAGIGRAASCIKKGDAEGLLALLNQTPELHWQDTPAHWGRWFAELLESAWQPYLTAPEPSAALTALSEFVLLSALRQGPYGVEGLNQGMEQALSQAGLLQRRGHWYPRRPVLITENDYRLELYNGDIGVCWQTGRELRVWFQQLDGQLRSFSPMQLGAHETAWALTVHKSQGSEFQRLQLVLPPEPHPLLTRELLYTALTRARQQVGITGPQAVLQAAVKRRIQRASGLVESLQAEALSAHPHT